MIRMTRLLPVAIAIATVSPAMAATPGPAFDRGDWQDDYAFLKQALQRDYAGVSLANPRKDEERLGRAVIDGKGGC